MKKILAGIAVVLVLFIGALLALPYLFKDEIIAQVKQAANESLTATIDFEDVSLSVFSHFPKLSIGLQGLTVTGTEQFDGVKLLDCKQMDIAVDLWSAIFGDQVIIKGFYLKEPKIKVYILEDGSANYDISKPEPEPTTATAEAGSPVRLEHYAITDGYVLYDDRTLNMRAELEGLSHEGSGEFTADIYDLLMKTDVQKLSVNYEGMQYLRNAHTTWDATLNADMTNMKFTFKENDLQINALDMMVDGWFQMPNDTDYLMDLKFATPQNTFKSFLSIIPGAYTQDFDGVKADGTVKFGGMVRGKYNETTYPAFKIDLKIANGNVKYPSLPLGISGINVDMSVNSPSSSLNAMTVNIPSFALRIGSNPIAGYFNLKLPETNPTIDTKITGTLNMAELSKAFPMEGVQELSGIIKADVLAKASMNQIDAGQYDQVTMAGNFNIQNLNYREAGAPTVKINNLSVSLSPQYVDLKNFDARLGKSDIRAFGRIDNILAYFSTDKTMTGSLNMRSAYFDANEWMTEEPTAEAEKVPTASAETTEKVFDQWDFTLDGAIGKLVYEDYNISDMRLKGNFTPNKMTLDDFGMKIDQSDLSGNGRILNAWDYMFDNRTVSGVVNLNSNYFDLNPFMTDAAPATEEAAPAESVMLIPENVDMTLNANFAKVQYTDMTLSNLDGQVVVKNGVASLNDFTAGVLGGEIAIAGKYSTQDPAKPAFDVNLALMHIGFKQAYENFVSIQTLAPIAQYIDGSFNTTLSMSGLLGKDMTPDFNTLSAAGFLETLDAMLKNFKPISEIGSKLNVSYLSSGLELKNTKNWFEIKDGQVIVKPFNVQMRDVAMQIGGSHGISQDMNYQILTKTPRSALEKSAAGSVANSGLKWLSGEAAKVGVNVAQGEYINVRFDITGNLKNPKVSFKILPSDGESTIREEASETVQAAVGKARDSLQNVAARELDKVKEKATATAEKALDSVKNVATQKAEELKDKAVQEAGKAVGEEVSKKVGDEAGKKVDEVLNQNKTTEEAKKKLEEWNPLKKKKNN